MKVGLCQIVKNESEVIERCLDSVKDFIDYVYISDTGSTDNTIEIINNWLIKNNKEGKIASHKWKNFAHNRSLVLKELKALKKVDYILMIDADEVMVFDRNPKEVKENLTADLYDVLTIFPDCTYYRPQLSSTRLDIYYKGVVHEFVEADIKWKTRTELKGAYNRPLQDSNRNKLGNKTSRDAELLEQALETETDNFMRTRYTFYLARSLIDSGQKRKALVYFEKRVKMRGWEQEVYISLIEIGRIRESLGYFSADILDAYYQAFELIPERLEAIYYIVRYCRSHNKAHQGYHIAKAGLSLKMKDKFLFNDPMVYNFKFMDEFALSAYWSERYDECLKIYEELIVMNKVPNDQLPRILENINFAKSKL